MPVIRKLALGIAFGIVIVPAALIWREPWLPMTAPEIAVRTAALWRYGAVDVPHDMAGPENPKAGLMVRVAKGEELSAPDSTAYRLAIQQVLAANQRLFAVLDNNIVFASDTGPNDPNNCGGTGIAGRHDLHAASAASNFAELDASLKALSTAGPLGRIRHANRAYKSLTDLMVHLAPAVHSVVLKNSPALPETADPALAQGFEHFRLAMTEASFAPIGSAAYNQALDQAQTAYAALVLTTQTRIIATLSPLEQRLAGRWLSLQSVSPRLTLPAQ
jgi:hypothetical protein